MTIEKDEVKNLLYTKVKLTRFTRDDKKKRLCTHIGYVIRVKDHYRVEVIFKTKKRYQFITMNYIERFKELCYVDNDNDTTILFRNVEREMTEADHNRMKLANVAQYELCRLHDAGIIENHFLVYLNGNNLAGVMELGNGDVEFETKLGTSILNFIARISMFDLSPADFNNFNELKISFGTMMSILKKCNINNLRTLNTIHNVKNILVGYKDYELAAPMRDIELKYLAQMVIDPDFNYDSLVGFDEHMKSLMAIVKDKYFS